MPHERITELVIGGFEFSFTTVFFVDRDAQVTIFQQVRQVFVRECMNFFQESRITQSVEAPLGVNLTVILVPNFFFESVSKFVQGWIACGDFGGVDQCGWVIWF